MACVHVIKFLFGITRMAYLEFISICVYFIKQPMAFFLKKKKKNLLLGCNSNQKKKKTLKTYKFGTHHLVAVGSALIPFCHTLTHHWQEIVLFENDT